MRKLLHRTPDWLLFGAGSAILAAFIEGFRTGLPAEGVKTAVVGALLVMPLFRFWLLPPRAGHDAAHRRTS